MGRKEVAARCEHDVLAILQNNVLTNHVCSKPKGKCRDSKPMDPDLLNWYCIAIGAAGQPLFDTNQHYSVCYKLEKAISRKMGKGDLRQFDEQLRVEAKEAERAAVEVARLEQVRHCCSLRSAGPIDDDVYDLLDQVNAAIGPSALAAGNDNDNNNTA